MDWKERYPFVIQDENQIAGFFGDYRWLSNFHPCQVTYRGVTYPHSESAYQAQKVKPSLRILFSDPKITGAQSKKLVKTLLLNDDNKQFTAEEFDAQKYQMMLDILRDKFKDAELSQKLLDTGNRFLVELNSWGDTYWGVDVQKGGANQLGKILMTIRDEIRPKILTSSDGSYHWDN